MSLITEALKRAQEELNRRNVTSYPFDTSRATKPSHQKNKKPFVIFLCSGIFLGAITLLLLGLIIQPEPILGLLGYKSNPTPASAQIASTEAPLYEASSNDTLTSDEKKLTEALSSSEILNTLTEALLNKMASQQIANTSATEEALTTLPTTIAASTTSSENAKEDQIALNTSTLSQMASSLAPAQNSIETQLAKLKITGIMFSGPDSKVIIDNKILSLHSKVIDDPEVRLSEINSHELVFTDANGSLYKKKI